MTILAGYVPTDLGQEVLQVAIREAVLRDRPLVVVNSATGGSYVDRGLATDEQLDEAAEHARAQGVTVEVRQVKDALSVAETLLGEASIVDAELLVIGMRSRSRTGKFLLGSTAQTLLLRAPCHVLAVRAARGT